MLLRPPVAQVAFAASVRSSTACKFRADTSDARGAKCLSGMDVGFTFYSFRFRFFLLRKVEADCFGFNIATLREKWQDLVFTLSWICLIVQVLKNFDVGE